MPSATSTLESGLSLLCSIAANRLDTLFSPMRSSSSRPPSSREYRSATSAIRPLSSRMAVCLLPSPSMSMAPLLTKCSNSRAS